MPNHIYVSVMAQYFPTYRAKQDEYINRKLNLKEYKEIEKLFIYIRFRKWIYARFRKT